jgi:CRISPR-associated protein Csx17
MDKQGKAFALWTQRGRYVVWNSYDLVQNMVAILDRRIMDGEREGCEALPLEGSRTASLDAVAAFIAGETDDERITELLWGMILIDQKGKDLWRTKRSIDTVPLPRVYALLKLLFLPRPLPTTLGDVIIRPEPAIVALLRAKRLGDACDIALRRLRASGLVPICSQRGFNNKNVKCWHVHDTTRLAAALLIPVSRADIDSLKRLVLRGTTAFSV